MPDSCSALLFGLIMINEELRKKLFELQDVKFRGFVEGLTPGENNMIGVRMPLVKNMAKEIAGLNYAEFLENPFTFYHEERLLYGLVISYLKTDLSLVLNYLDGFLEYVNNWAVCDTVVMNLKIFNKEQNKEEALNYLISKLNDENPFVIRFAIVGLFCYFKDDKYCVKTLEILKGVKQDHFYIKMALAWGICEFLIKHYDLAIEVLKNRELNIWVHNKAIQKALESFRIDVEKKKELKGLKIA